MQIFENDYSFWLFCITIFPEKTQNKNKVGMKNDLFINDGNA